MKNADMPAMPTRDAIEDCGPDGSQGPNMVPVDFGGLTKREYLAALAMQGLCADLTASEAEGYTVKPDIVATDAVQYADALLAELEKTS